MVATGLESLENFEKVRNFEKRSGISKEGQEVCKKSGNFINISKKLGKK